MEDISRLRNVAFVGTHHSGKTTLVEAILEHCGAIPRRGSVTDGTTTTDYEPECIEHAQSTCVGFAHTQCGSVDLNIVDCPGFIDFFEETKTALLAADAAVIVLEADPTRIAQTRALVDAVEARRMPHLFVINKMDRPGADFTGTLAALQATYGYHVVAQHLPIGSGETFAGFVDLTEKAAYHFTGNTHRAAPLPDDMRDAIERERTRLLEALGDFDDRLMEELLEGVEPARDEIERDLCDDCAHDKVIPVLVAAGTKCAGIGALVDAIEREFPSPVTDPRQDVDGRTIEPRRDGPVVAQICKTIFPQSGKLSIARVLTGTLTAETQLVNASRNAAPLRAAGLYRLQGKRQDPIKSAGPGSIVAIARLENACTCDTLASAGTTTVLPCVPFADPVFALAIKPREKLDEAKLSAMLARLMDEDPALRVARAEWTNELQLMGAGEIHVKTATERLSRKYHLDLETHPPSVPYRETISQGTEVHARYKHQTGGHGQFGDVKLRIEPRPRGHGVSFSEAIVGGVVPRQFFPAVEKGVREALARGPIAGYPVVDVHVTLFDGAFHAVDSSEASFKTAASTAMRDGLPKCGPQLLEPILRVETFVPTPYASSVVQMLTGKRGQILAYESVHGGTGMEHIVAHVPQVELARFITELRTASQGLGTYTWSHERFDVVPERIVQALKEPALA